MKRFIAFLAIFFVLTLAMFVSFRVSKNEHIEKVNISKIGDENSVYPNEGFTADLVELDSVSGGILEDGARLPIVDLSSHYGANVVRLTETKIVENTDFEVTRSVLFQTKKSLIRKDEVFQRVSESEEWLLVGNTFMKGDELTFENDPSLVDQRQFNDFLRNEDLSVSWESRFSDYVQLNINNSSIDRFNHVLEQANQLFNLVISEPDFINFTSEVPNDYNSSRMWNLDQVSAEDAWSIETGSEDVVIAIIDTGADMNHVDLVANFWVNPLEIEGNGVDDDNNGYEDDISGWDFSDDDNDPNDTEGHGTHVSGIAAARGNNSLGVAGLAWGAKLLVLRVGDEDGLSNQAIAEALRYVEDLKLRGVNIVVTNNSYGGEGSSRSMERVIEDQEDAGILFVTAAGNDGNDIDGSVGQYPAGYDLDIIISVASTTQNDALVSSSNYGLESVDLAAPGNAIYSTLPGSSYGYLSGTSMASPLVAGAVGLVTSYEPELTWEEVKDRILDTVDEVSGLGGRVLTGGRLNAFTALDSEFLDFDISVPSHPGSLVFLSDSSHPISFSVDVVSGVDLSAEILNDDTSEVVVDGRVVTCRFARDGVYTIRFSASVSNYLKTIDRTVFVGETGDVTEGLLHYFSFEEDGSTISDLAGNGDGVLNNATIEEDGLGRSVRFTGSESNMEFESDASGQVTITALVNADQISHNAHPRIVNTPDYYLYVSSGDNVDTSDGNRNTFKFYSNRVNGDYGVWNTVPDSVETRKWVHIAVTYDSRSLSNSPLIYIDGESQVVRTQVSPTGTQSVDGGVSYVGDRDDAARPWDGLVDEVRIYGRILSSEEVAIVSSQYLKSRWSAYTVDEQGTDDALNKYFRYENSEGNVPEASFEWSLIDVVGSGSIEENGNGSVVVASSALKSATLQLFVSDDAAGEYLYYSISNESELPSAGIYRGVSSGGTIVWLEVDESLESGYLSIYDESSGYSRFRKPVIIDSDGLVSAIDNVGGALVGVVGSSFTGRIEGLDLALEADYFESSTDEFIFGGEYSGGVLATSDSYVDLLVSDWGDCLLVRRGAIDEVILATISTEGALEAGAGFSGEFSEDGNSFSGSFLNEGVEELFYLRKLGVVSSSEFVNLSTRSDVQEGERSLIGGFVIPEGEDRKILVRAAGPSLSSQGVQGFLANPKVEVVRDSEIIYSNSDWEVSSSSTLDSVFSTVGAFTFDEASGDASLELSLSPGVYTALVSSETEGDSGEALVEIYDIERGEEKALVNVSTRGYVNERDKYLIGGFVILGDEPKGVLVRAVGPGLIDHGVSDYLTDPLIELVRDSEVLTSNDNWMGGASVSSESSGSYRSFEIIETIADNVGAFSLDENSTDSAMVVWLEPGAYTVLVSGGANDEGVALVEIYDLP